MRRVSERRVGLLDLTIAVVVAGGTTVVATIVGLGTGTGPFVAMHVAYFGLVVAVPLIALGTLVLGRRELHPTLVIGAAVCLLPVPFGIYASHIEPGWLRLDRIEVPVSPERSGSGTVRVGVLSDMQMANVGDHERRAVRELMAQEPDLILVPGDLFHMEPDRFAARLDDLRSLYSELHAPYGVYVVPGDVDGLPMLRQVIEGTDLELLLDTTTRVDVRDRQLLIGGLDLEFGSAEAAQIRDELLAEPADGAIAVQFSHRPDAVLELPPSSRVDLTVSGHTHGGQIVLPLFGPPLTLSEVPRDVARGGLHEVDGNQIYVSPGVGAERGGAPQIRFLDRPSVAVLEVG